MFDTAQPDQTQDEIITLKETVEELRIQLAESREEIAELKKAKE
jgi:hypothetical protein